MLAWLFSGCLLFAFHLNYVWAERKGGKKEQKMVRWWRQQLNQLLSVCVSFVALLNANFICDNMLCMAWYSTVHLWMFTIEFLFFAYFPLKISLWLFIFHWNYTSTRAFLLLLAYARNFLLSHSLFLSSSTHYIRVCLIDLLHCKLVSSYRIISLLMELMACR